MDALWAYHWPGNIRELINALEYAFVTCSGDTIDISHLPDTVISSEDPAIVRASFHEDNPGKKQLIAALSQSDGKKSEAAKILGISRQALWKRIHKYGIEIRKTIITQ